MIVDDFISTFKGLKEYALNAEFKDEVNEIDKVVYPLICKDIPAVYYDEILLQIENILGRKPENILMFMRRSPVGVPCPHQVHSDAVMGRYSLMLYLQESIGGTALLHHKLTGIGHNPQAQELVDVITLDQNSPEKWVMDEYVQMKENRAFIFPSDRMHRAEPVGGFGEGKEARVVLTCFFS